MKITKLVVLFNKDKIVLGLAISFSLILFAFFVPALPTKILLLLSFLIILNISLAIIASYFLYDRSKLYKPNELFKSLKFSKNDKAILLHASFDPVSNELKELISPGQLKIYNIYGNRHEEDEAIKISNKVFPPNPNEEIVDPTQMPDKPNSIDYIFAMTSAHEILSQKQRINFFKETKRILKKDGELIVCEQLRDWINFVFFNIGAFHFVSLNNWQNAIEKSNLRIEKIEKITPWGTIMYIKK